ncbi:MAG TPA: glycosyl hydrolase family 18 protein [Candidatus Saccharimonadales bacterium]|nr:glycosyl hydrolase family 18 protein [Candidatus Saccharimonadales bacterium]
MLVVVGVAAVLIALMPRTGGAGADASPSPAGLVPVIVPGLSVSPPVSTGPPPEPGHEMYGFLPYWEMDDTIADHLEETDLSTLALFSVTHRRDGSMATTQNGYRRITGDVGRTLVREAHDRETRVEIVYTSFGEPKNRRFYDDPAAQAAWIETLVDFVEEQGVDGVNVDVELLPFDLVPAYGQFVGQLRAALVARLPDAQVSVATQANESGAAMAAAAAQAGADRIFMMGYDYHWAGSQPGASAPLERRDGEAKDLRWSLDLYAALGVPVERTLLGLPLYGITWPVEGPELGDFATGRGDGWVPRRNLGVLDDPDFEPTLDPIEQVEFYAVRADGTDQPDEATELPVEPGVDPSAAGSLEPAPPTGGWNAVYFDSPRSLTPKLALADERGLAGAGFWAIGYERGLPGYTDLIETFRAGEIRAP